jgi:hypothetical protein
MNEYMPERGYIQDPTSPEPFTAAPQFDAPKPVNVDGWPTQQQWATFCGGEDPDDAAHLEFHDDPNEGLDHMQWLKGGGFAYRTVAYGPWTVVHPGGGATA